MEQIFITLMSALPFILSGALLVGILLRVGRDYLSRAHVVQAVVQEKEICNYTRNGRTQTLRESDYILRFRVKGGIRSFKTSV